jgi:hypothetical protein
MPFAPGPKARAHLLGRSYASELTTVILCTLLLVMLVVAGVSNSELVCPSLRKKERWVGLWLNFRVYDTVLLFVETQSLALERIGAI